MVLLLLCAAVAAASTEQRTLSRLLRTVPLARRTPLYYLVNRYGEFGRLADPTTTGWVDLPVSTVLELSAGRSCRWSRSVAAARPDARVTAADLLPPLACEPCDAAVESVACDNADLGAFARQSGQTYDLVYGSHVLCTCKFVAGARETCGGVGADVESVDRFVDGLAALLRPRSGIAVFDHEAGWPFGLERKFRVAARRNAMAFYVRRGPLFTNANYVFSADPALVDDVSPDVLQRTSRGVDVVAVAVAVGLGLGGDLPENFDAAVEAALWLLVARWSAPLCDIFTVADLRDALGFRGSSQ